MKAVIILYSYHHRNTEKIAEVCSRVLDAEVKSPEQVDPDALQQYDLVGFGSGIYSAKHHTSLLELADRLQNTASGKAFLFSTAAMTNMKKVVEDHSELREILQSKGYIILDDFQCLGFNTNSFLRFFGGMNKGRPNAEDLRQAEDFARGLLGLV